MQLSAFAGRWRIDRAIEDVRAGATGALVGTASFTPAPDGLAYVEEGALTLAGAAPITATRRYLWRNAGASAIEVLFADGRFFHRFYADEDAPAAVHDCPPDQYRVRYDFAAWPRWTAEWRVRGPRKDYAMVTTYRRDPKNPDARPDLNRPARRPRSDARSRSAGHKALSYPRASLSQRVRPGRRETRVRPRGATTRRFVDGQIDERSRRHASARAASSADTALKSQASQG